MNCPSCGDTLSERGPFCKSCSAQARCMSCKALLEHGAAACVECGAKVGTSNDATGAVPQLARNKITYHEDQNGRDLDADFSDTTMQAFGEVLGSFFATRGIVSARPTFDTPPVVEPPPGRALPPPPDATPPAAPAAAAASAKDPDLNYIAEIFRVNGDQLELIDNQLKANSGMDYARRLTYLALYAYELHGQAWVPKASITAILKEGKVLDNNSRAWLKKTQGFRADAEGKLQLIKGGRDSAKKALAEYLDPNVTDDWHPDKKVATKRGPRKKKE